MLNNVCKTAFQPYESSPAFKFKRSFSKALFSGGKASATKGKYRGIALSHLLVRFDSNVMRAEALLKQCYLVLGTISPTAWKTNLAEKLRESLCVLKQVILQEVSEVQEKLLNLGENDFQEKHRIFSECGPKFLNTMTSARM